MTAERPEEPGRVPVGELRELAKEWDKQRTGNYEVDKAYERAAERLTEVIEDYE